jgi:hypothetical protein
MEPCTEDVRFGFRRHIAELSTGLRAVMRITVVFRGPSSRKRRAKLHKLALLPVAIAVASGCTQTSETNDGIAVEADVPPYVARFRTDGNETPDTNDVGAFFIRSGCLVFVSDSGTSYLPVLPRSAELVRSAGGWRLQVGGKSVSEGRNYQVAGGEGQYGPVDPKPPATCPSKQFLVREIR